MRESIFAFMFGGLVGGLVAGFVDVIGFVDSANAIFAFLGAAGIDALCGMVCGAFVGLIHPLVPKSLYVTAIWDGAWNRMKPSTGESLQARCRTVLSIWLFLFVPLAALIALASGYRFILMRLQSVEFAIIAVGLFGVLCLVAMFSLALPVQAVAARGLEFLIRRNPKLSALSEPRANFAIALFLALLNLASWMWTEEKTFDAFQQRVFWSLCFLTTGLIVTGERVKPYLEHLSTARGIQAVVLMVFFAGASVSAGLRAPESREIMLTDAGTAKAALTIVQGRFDGDEDGFSRILGGGDCNDADPSVNPLAEEIVGNSVDENCDGLVEGYAGRRRQDLLAKKDGVVIKPPYNIVLITVGGLRADHLGFYGYGRETSPAIDDVAGGSVLFERAYTASSTMPLSLAAIMNGSYPSELSRSSGLYPNFDDENVFLAERLSALGYQTAGFPSHWYFDSKPGLEQGFDVWRPYAVEKGRMENVPTAETVITTAVEYLHSVAPDPQRPFFIWLHLLDPQSVYLEHLDIPRFGNETIDQYDHEIRYVDTWLKWLFDMLVRRDDWDRTAIVLSGAQAVQMKAGASDIPFLHDRNARTPLLIRVPGIPARPIQNIVSAVDVAPTLIELAGGEWQSGTMGSGRSLVPALNGVELEPREVFCELPDGVQGKRTFAWWSGQDKLVFDGEKSEWRRYDLATDIDERKDLYSLEASKSESLRKVFLRFQSNLQLKAPMR